MAIDLDQLEQLARDRRAWEAFRGEASAGQRPWPQKGEPWPEGVPILGVERWLDAIAPEVVLALVEEIRALRRKILSLHCEAHEP